MTTAIYVVVPGDDELGWLSDGVAYEAESPQHAVDQFMESNGASDQAVPEGFYDDDTEPNEEKLEGFFVYGPFTQEEQKVTTAQVAPTEETKKVYVVTLGEKENPHHTEQGTEQAYLALHHEDAINQYIITQGQGQEDVPGNYYDSDFFTDEVLYKGYIVYGPYEPE